MRRNFFRLLVFAMVVSLCATAALSPAQNAPAGKIKLEFWHYFSDSHLKALNDLIAQFQKDNPNIEVTPVYQGRAQELLQKLQSSLAATPGNNPVLSTVYENWTSDFVTKGLLDPVEDHFAGADGLTPAEQNDIVKVFRESNTYNGKMVTMPFNKSIYVLYVNVDRLKQAGFTTAPQTLAEFKDAIKKLTVRQGRRVATYGLGVAPTSEAFTTLFFASGGEYFDKSNQPVFDSPEGAAVLNFLKDLQFPDKHLYVSTDYMNTPFGNQQVAMYIYSSASFPFNEKAVAGKFKWDVAPIPHLEGKEPRYLMQGTNIAIFKNRSQAERDAAWKFLKFLTSTKSAAYFETRSGYMPIRYSVLGNPEMQAYMANNPRYAMASSLVLGDKGKQEPKMAVWEGIRNDLNAMVDRVLSRGADPKAELAAMKQKTLEWLKRSDKK